MPAAPPRREEGYSIDGAAAGNPQKARSIAASHLRWLAEWEDWLADRLDEAAQVEELLRAFRAGVTRAGETNIGWQKLVLEEWIRANPPKKGRRQLLLTGWVGLRLLPGKTEICDEAVIALAQARSADGDDSLWEAGPDGKAIVELRPRVNRKAFRARFEVASAGVVDTVTGEVLEPAPVEKDGQVLLMPLMIQTAPPHDKLTYQITTGALNLPPAQGGDEDGSGDQGDDA